MSRSMASNQEVKKSTPIADKLTPQLDDFYSKQHNKSHLPQVSNSLQPRG